MQGQASSSTVQGFATATLREWRSPAGYRGRKPLRGCTAWRRCRGWRPSPDADGRRRRCINYRTGGRRPGCCCWWRRYGSSARLWFRWPMFSSRTGGDFRPCRRKAYERCYEYRSHVVIRAGIGSNGFLVTAYPQSWENLTVMEKHHHARFSTGPHMDE